MALTGLLTFWVLTLATRGASPATPIRYLYPAAALVLVAVGELPSLIIRERGPFLPADAPPWGRRVAIVAMVGIVGYVGLAIWWNSDVLRSGSTTLATSESQIRAEEGVLDLAGQTLPPTYQPDPVEMPQVTVGSYLRAAAAFGSPGDGRSAIMTSSEAVRSTIDGWLLRGLPMRIVPASGGGETSCGCAQVPVGGVSPPPTFQLPVRGAGITAPADAALSIRVKSFSNTFPLAPVTTVAPGSVSTIKWSTVPNGIRWEVELTPVPTPAASGSFAIICT